MTLTSLVYDQIPVNILVHVSTVIVRDLHPHLFRIMVNQYGFYLIARTFGPPQS